MNFLKGKFLIRLQTIKKKHTHTQNGGKRFSKHQIIMINGNIIILQITTKKNYYKLIKQKGKCNCSMRKWRRKPALRTDSSKNNNLNVDVFSPMVATTKKNHSRLYFLKFIQLQPKFIKCLKSIELIK